MSDEFPVTVLRPDGLLFTLDEEEDGGLIITMDFSSPKVEQRFAKRAAKEGMDLDIYMQLIIRQVKTQFLRKPTGIQFLFLRLKTRFLKKLREKI